jgi:hypothetical protein
MNLKELLNLFTDKEILVKLFKLYPDQRKSKAGYLDALAELRAMRPTKDSIQILVHTVKADKFNDEDYVSISGVDPKEPDTNYAIEFDPWHKWLGRSLHSDTAINFPPLDALCHCLWEMTWSGYSNKEVKAKAKELFGHMAKVMKDIDAKRTASG